MLLEMMAAAQIVPNLPGSGSGRHACPSARRDRVLTIISLTQFAPRARHGGSGAVATMKRYFFHLHECGTLIADEEGRELAGMDVARREALAAARSIMASEVLAGRLCLGCRIEVQDSEGNLLLSLPFSEALAVSGR